MTYASFFAGVTYAFALTFIWPTGTNVFAKGFGYLERNVCILLKCYELFCVSLVIQHSEISVSLKRIKNYTKDDIVALSTLPANPTGQRQTRFFVLFNNTVSNLYKFLQHPSFPKMFLKCIKYLKAMNFYVILFTKQPATRIIM